MNENAALEQWGPGFVWWGGLVLFAIGVVKMIIYVIGARRPGWFAGIQSETLRRFLAGRGNRLVFGWGGLITAAVGAFFMLAAKGLTMLMEHLRL